MNNAVVLFMENKSFQLSTELNLPNTIASQTLLPSVQRHFPFCVL